MSALNELLPSLLTAARGIIAAFGCICLVVHVVVPCIATVVELAIFTVPEEVAKWRLQWAQESELKALEDRVAALQKRRIVQMKKEARRAFEEQKTQSRSEKTKDTEPKSSGAARTSVPKAQDVVRKPFAEPEVTDILNSRKPADRVEKPLAKPSAPVSRLVRPLQLLSPNVPREQRVAAYLKASAAVSKPTERERSHQPASSKGRVLSLGNIFDDGEEENVAPTSRAGKTTLARQWIEQHRGEPSFQPKTGTARRTVIERVSFDDLYASGAAASAADEFDPVQWKAAQDEMAQMTKKRLARHREEAPGSVLLILIDDNFHYRSMRKSFFQIADDASCGFGIVYIHTPVSICRARNAAREGAARVPETAFTRMAQAFEVPEAAFPHETNLATVSSESHDVAARIESDTGVVAFDVAISKVILRAEELWTEAQTTKERQASQRLQQAADKKLTAASVAHHVDLALRRYISKVLHGTSSVAFDNEDKPQKAMLAKYLNEKRKALLVELRGMPLDELHSTTLEQGYTERLQAAVIHWLSTSKDMQKL